MEYLEIGMKFPRLSGCAVTMGKFDGVHQGHRKLIHKILEQREQGAKAVVLAFVSAKSAILTRTERKKLLESMGVDVLLECPLDERFRHMRAENFIREILVGDLHTVYAAVGEDFRFGFERRGTPSFLREMGDRLGFRTEILPKEMDGRRKISSTYIREELKYGNMEKVSFLLGTDFYVEGRVSHGRGLGHRFLFPTANLYPPVSKLMPPNGVYITVSRFADGKQYPGITNVGNNPTVGEKALGVESFLFGCREDLYEKDCVVQFKKYLRPEHKFASLDALKAQMEKDIAVGKAYFEQNPVDK